MQTAPPCFLTLRSDLVSVLPLYSQTNCELSNSQREREVIQCREVMTGQLTQERKRQIEGEIKSSDSLPNSQ